MKDEDERKKKGAEDNKCAIERTARERVTEERKLTIQAEESDAAAAGNGGRCAGLLAEEGSLAEIVALCAAHDHPVLADLLLQAGDDDLALQVGEERATQKHAGSRARE